jgi:hypothetical protein
MPELIWHPEPLLLSGAILGTLRLVLGQSANRKKNNEARTD